jgi:hypothetical protein
MVFCRLQSVGLESLSIEKLTRGGQLNHIRNTIQLLVKAVTRFSKEWNAEVENDQEK